MLSAVNHRILSLCSVCRTHNLKTRRKDRKLLDTKYNDVPESVLKSTPSSCCLSPYAAANPVAFNVAFFLKRRIELDRFSKQIIKMKHDRSHVVEV